MILLEIARGLILMIFVSFAARFVNVIEMINNA